MPASRAVYACSCNLTSVKQTTCSGAWSITVLLFRRSLLKDSLMKFGIHRCKYHAENPSVASDFFICAVLFLGVWFCAPLPSLQSGFCSCLPPLLQFSLLIHFCVSTHALNKFIPFRRLSQSVFRSFVWCSWFHLHKFHSLASFDQFLLAFGWGQIF